MAEKRKPKAAAKPKATPKPKPKPKTQAKAKSKPTAKAAPKRKAGASHWEKPLADNLLRELNAQAEDGVRHLMGKAAATATPKDVVAALLAHVDKVHAGEIRSPKGKDDHVLMLACAWGEQVCRGLGYQWVHVQWEGGGSIGIVPDNRAFAIYPMPYIRRIYEDPHADNTILLLYNMLAAGNVPQSKPWTYLTLG